MRQKGKDHWKYAGGSHMSGYIARIVPEHPYAQPSTGYVLEHRLVMEKHLGRYLEPNEEVHHINGIRSDNRLENLVVLTHKKHLRGHLSSSAKLEKLDNPQWLNHELNELGKTAAQIARELNCSPWTVRHFLEVHHIRLPESVDGHIPQKFPELRDKAWLTEATATMSQRAIARKLGCNHRLVHQFQKLYGIKSTHKPTGLPKGYKFEKKP